MKKSELFFTAALVPLDIFSLFLAGMAAYTLRFHPFFTDLRPVLFDITLQEFAQILSPLILVWIGVFALSGLYNTKPPRLTHELVKVFLACSTSMAVLFALLFFSRSLFESRFIVLAAWGFAILFVGTERVLLRTFQRILLSFGIGQHRLAIIGKNTSAEALMEEFAKKHRLGFQVIAQYAHFDKQTKQNLIQLKTENSLEEILLADPHLSSEQTLELVALCDSEHLTCKYTADLFATAVGKTDIAMYAGIPIIEIKKTPLDGWGQIAKRIFDLFFSLLFIILFSPLMLLTAMMIKLDSKGPVFYLDYRTGQHNKKFIFYKFRSMIAELCDGEGPSGTQKGNTYLDQLEKEKNNLRTGDPLHKIKDDPRITRFGRFIRKWSIDELPQLFNVLRGDISLVGPRPHMTLETAKYEKRYRNVFTIKPGITGLAQISGRSDLGFEEEIRLDTYYIENWNILLDISILLRTPLAIIKPRKAE